MKHGIKELVAVMLATMGVLGLGLPTSAATAKRGKGVVINVTDYAPKQEHKSAGRNSSADPQEYSTALRAALKYAKEKVRENVPKTLSFPKGEYHFFADQSEVRELYVSNTIGVNQNFKNKHLGILVEDMKNVTIDGNGSKFIFHGDVTSFAAIRSKNVIFKNFTVDAASPSVIDVTVKAYDDDGVSAILFVPACYTYELRNNGTSIFWKVEDDNTHSGGGNLSYQQACDVARHKTFRGAGKLPFSNVVAIKEIGNNCLKVTYNNPGNRPVLGRCFQMRNTARTTPGTFFWECDGVTVKNVNFQYLHGFGMVGQLSKNILLDGLKFKADPDSGRTTAGFADFIQMSSVGGKVAIRNCYFANPHDDPINVHGTFLRVKDVSPDNKTFILRYQHHETGGFPQFYVGDEVEFATQGSMAYKADSRRKVVRVVQPGQDGNDLNTTTLTLDRPVAGITPDKYVVENLTYTPDVLIERCRFTEVPTRGILVTTRGKVIIRNNHFDRMNMAAIFISCDASSWWESGRTQDVTIRNNEFHLDASNAVFVEPTGVGEVGNRVHNNMTIADNTIYLINNQRPFNIKSVDGLTIKGNKILRQNADGKTFGTKLYRFDSCENVSLSDNTYDDGLNPRILLTNTPTDNVKVTNDKASLNGGN